MYQSVTLVTDGNTSDNPRKKIRHFCQKIMKINATKLHLGTSESF